MPERTNLDTMRAICDALAVGDGRPLNAAMADDFSWTIKGTTSWSGTYRGKEAVNRDLLRPLMKQFATRYTNTAQRLIAESEFVVVQCRGDVTTTSGKRYANDYCWICRFRDGQLVELVEYMDTQHLAETLGPGPMAAA